MNPLVKGRRVILCLSEVTTTARALSKGILTFQEISRDFDSNSHRVLQDAFIEVVGPHRGGYYICMLVMMVSFPTDHFPTFSTSWYLSLYVWLDFIWCENICFAGCLVWHQLGLHEDCKLIPWACMLHYTYAQHFCLIQCFSCGQKRLQCSCGPEGCSSFAHRQCPCPLVYKF